MALTIYNAKPYDSLSIALGVMGSNDGHLIVSGQEDITSDLTVPSNICIEFPKGGSLNVSTGVTVTFNQRPEAGRYKIFYLTGTASVVFDAVANVDIYPEWWGT